MLRKIVQINEEKCNGCGLCIGACHEAALQLIDGKAKLVSDNLCDGLGACLPDCPQGAITIIEREAAAFDEAAVQHQVEQQNHRSSLMQPAGGCPGSKAKMIKNEPEGNGQSEAGTSCSELRQWPCQLQLVPASASYFDHAQLLVAADCAAYAYANLHAEFMRDRVTVIGCPKLDKANYAAKLTEILQLHEIKSITVVRMEVPCCGGIVKAVKEAMSNSGKAVPCNVVTIGTDGIILESNHE